MRREAIALSCLAAVVFVALCSLPAHSNAHTATAVNGSALITLGKSGVAVEYQIECGVRTAVDVRSRIDRTADGLISRQELDAFNETTRQKLREVEGLSFILLDAKPVKLQPGKLAFTIEGSGAETAVFLNLRLTSEEPLAPGFHRLVLDSSFCPLDAELLSLPAAAVGRHQHGGLVRILKITVLMGSPGEFLEVSDGHIARRDDRQTVRCLLNNITKRVQVNFQLGQASLAEAQASAEPPSPVADATSVDAITRATPAASRLPAKITEKSTIDALTFDPVQERAGKLAYKLSRPALVRIRVLLRGDEDMVLRTLEDWSPRKAGTNVEEWDGRDAGGLLIDKVRFPCFISIEADSEAHRDHPRMVCKDLRLKLRLKGGSLTVAQPTVPVEVVVDEETRGYGEWLGYSLRAYVDFEPVHSATYHTRGWRGLEFLLDTAGLRPGEHVLTVVIDDGADHVGSMSLQFTVPG